MAGYHQLGSRNVKCSFCQPLRGFSLISTALRFTLYIYIYTDSHKRKYFQNVTEDMITTVMAWLAVCVPTAWWEVGGAVVWPGVLQVMPQLVKDL